MRRDRRNDSLHDPPPAAANGTGARAKPVAVRSDDVHLRCGQDGGGAAGRDPAGHGGPAAGDHRLACGHVGGLCGRRTVARILWLCRLARGCGLGRELLGAGHHNLCAGHLAPAQPRAEHGAPQHLHRHRRHPGLNDGRVHRRRNRPAPHLPCCGLHLRGRRRRRQHAAERDAARRRGAAEAAGQGGPPRLAVPGVLLVRHAAAGRPRARGLQLRQSVVRRDRQNDAASPIPGRHDGHGRLHHRHRLRDHERRRARVRSARRVPQRPRWAQAGDPADRHCAGRGARGPGLQRHMRVPRGVARPRHLHVGDRAHVARLLRLRARLRSRALRAALAGVRRDSSLRRHHDHLRRCGLRGAGPAGRSHRGSGNHRLLAGAGCGMVPSGQPIRRPARKLRG
mmetsp:Transcript_9095/g.23262  ORF Transcript_9095/g.23262 Transcript_9095/m.23262 type:complete len:396 (-) Transcript_9095:224-1411(-)